MSPSQCRAARALLGISQIDLARMANVSPSTVREFEVGKRRPMGNNLTAMQRALEDAEIVFFDTAEEFISPGPGVCLRAS